MTANDIGNGACVVIAAVVIVVVAWLRFPGWGYTPNDPTGILDDADEEWRKRRKPLDLDSTD